MKASDLFVRALEAEGVTHVFGLPGEENLDFVESLRESKIRFVVTRHEQAAGIMAATWGRLTGKTGVCLSTLGPGATNLVTAAAYAELGGMPMLMITGQKPIKKSKQGQFQIVDVVSMMRPLTKYAQTIVAADSIPARVRESFRRAEEERPGAVHLELPEDIAREDADQQPIAPSFARRPDADEAAIAKAVTAITNAKRPLLMIGAGANRKRTSQALTAFVERTGMPFFSTQLGKGVVDETNPAFLGTAALSSGDFVHKAIDQADCVVVVGHDVIEKPPFFMRPGRTVVHVDFSSAAVDSVYHPDIEVTGDIANAVWRLAQGLESASWDFAAFDRVRRAQRAHLTAGDADDRFPIQPARLVAEVHKAMPADGIVCLDNGMYKIWFARHYACRKPGTLILDNALATMGAGLPSAIAATLVHPQRKVLAVAGDGGIMMSSQELETAVRLGLHLVVMVVRDDGYGMIRWKQQEMNLPDFGMTVGNPDFVKLAEAYGAVGHRPSSAAEVGTTLAHCLEVPGVHLIDVAIDYAGNRAALGHELAEATKDL